MCVSHLKKIEQKQSIQTPKFEHHTQTHMHTHMVAKINTIQGKYG